MSLHGYKVRMLNLVVKIRKEKTNRAIVKSEERMANTTSPLSCTVEQSQKNMGWSIETYQQVKLYTSDLWYRESAETLHNDRLEGNKRQIIYKKSKMSVENNQAGNQDGKGRINQCKNNGSGNVKLRSWTGLCVKGKRFQQGYVWHQRNNQRKKYGKPKKSVQNHRRVLLYKTRE